MNKYLYSKAYKSFTIIHKDKRYNPFKNNPETIPNHLNLSGKFDGLRIKREFVNTYQILFEVTQSCNLSCKYCAYGKLYSNSNKERLKNLSFLKAKRLIDFYLELRDSSVYNSYNRSITIGFYGGEPLLNFKLISEIVSYVEGRLPNITYNMTTNGTLVNRYIDYLKQKNFSLLISLDGNEICNSYRVFKNNTNSFKTVFNNIIELREKYPDYFLNKVSFNSVLNNRSSVESIYDFFKTNFDKIPRISEISPTGILEEKRGEYLNIFQSLNYSFEQAKNCSELYEEMKSESPSARSLIYFLFNCSSDVFRSYNDFFIEHNLIKYMPTASCAPFSRKVFLLADGRLLPCERISQTLTYGKVTKNRVDLDFEKIAKKQNDYYNKIRHNCSKCEGIEFCLKCLLQMDNLENKPICTSFTSQESSFNQYISSHISLLEAKPFLYKDIWENAVLE